MIQEAGDEYDTARRYDEVVDMGEDHESLEDEVLEMGLQKAEIVGLPRNNDLQSVQFEETNDVPENSQSDKGSIQS